MKARQLATGIALLFEVRELARHSDIRMTMRYTHIGLDDQARAVAAIPAPRTPQAKASDAPQLWECLRSEPCGKPCHFPSSAGNTVTMELATVNDENPCGDRGLDAVCPPVALDSTKDEKWRRRESNECPHLCKALNQHALLNGTEDMAAFCQCQDVTDCPQLSAFEPSLKRIIAVWQSLPEAIRDKVEALCLQPASRDASN